MWWLAAKSCSFSLCGAIIEQFFLLRNYVHIIDVFCCVIWQGKPREIGSKRYLNNNIMPEHSKGGKANRGRESFLVGSRLWLFRLFSTEVFTRTPHKQSIEVAGDLAICSFCALLQGELVVIGQLLISWLQMLPTGGFCCSKSAVMKVFMYTELYRSHLIWPQNRVLH